MILAVLILILAVLLFGSSFVIGFLGVILGLIAFFVGGAALCLALGWNWGDLIQPVIYGAMGLFFVAAIAGGILSMEDKNRK